MSGDLFDREAAAVSQRWALRMREMGYLHAAAELDHAAVRIVEEATACSAGDTVYDPLDAACA